MKPPLFSLVFLLALLTASCAFHSGMMSANLPESGTRFEFKRMAFGRSSVTRVFGLGGLGTEGLVLDAKRDMYRNYPLMKGEAYANVSVDYKNTFIIVAHITEVVVSADIVQLGLEISQKQQQMFLEENLGERKRTNYLLDSNSVIVTNEYHPKYGTILDINCLNSGAYKCDVKGFETGRIKSFNNDNIYRAYGTFENGYNETLTVGEKVDLYSINSSDKTRKKLVNRYRAIIYGYKDEYVFISVINLNDKHLDYKTVHHNRLKPIK